MPDLNQIFTLISSTTIKSFVIVKPGLLALIKSIGSALVYFRDEVIVSIISWVMSFIK